VSSGDERLITAFSGEDVAGAFHAELVDLYGLSYREPPWDETDEDVAAYAARIREWAGYEGFTGLAVRDPVDGRLTGVVYGWFHPAESGGRPLPGVEAARPFHVGDLMVHPLARRQGLGRHLVDRLTADRRPAVLLTHPDSAARRIYEAAGWRHTGELDQPDAPTRSVFVLDPGAGPPPS